MNLQPLSWTQILVKNRWIGVVFALCSANAWAQFDGGNINDILTVSGPLQIVKLARPAPDGANFRATLNGSPFDQLYGLRFIYYADSPAEGKPASRVVIEDFINGFSDAPSVTLYDFQKKPATLLPISDRLDVDDVRWANNSVELRANGQWFAFSGHKLIRIRPVDKRQRRPKFFDSHFLHVVAVLDTASSRY
ncbi:hypothetical protein [Paraburkholderia caledonica]